MLSNQHFYHRITRKMVVAFGTMFNNIRLVRYNKTGTTEIERISVPLTYSGKEKFYTRITQDPNLNKEVQITLPRMSFELESITYDPLRKRSAFINEFSPNTNTTIKSGYKTPYNFNFILNIYVRNTEDGTQIIEQILPYFNPDYTITVNLANVGNPVDVPIILQTVSMNMQNDTGTPEEMRIITWSLSFSAQAYLYGPIDSSDNNKVIRKAIANTFMDGSGTNVERKLYVANGTGNYKIDELVYEGKTLEQSNVTAFVKKWDTTSNTLVVYDINGTFNSNTKLKGAVTNSTWTLTAFENYENQVTMLTVEPNPSTANANDDFGFTETIYEYPDLP